MFKIVKKRQLSDKVILMDIEAKRVAKKCLPGEFVIVKANEKGERIPLTVCDYNRDAGTVTIVFQTVGFSTELFGRYNEGDYYADFVGPLGNPSELVVEDPETLKDKKILFVGGGLGIAPWHCLRFRNWCQKCGLTDFERRDGSRFRQLIHRY